MKNTVAKIIISINHPFKTGGFFLGNGVPANNKNATTLMPAAFYYLLQPWQHAGTGLATRVNVKRNKMINQYEVPAYLVDELPEIKEELRKISPTLNIFKSVECLANYTRGKVAQHDFKVVKKCFAIAENIYEKGNCVVRDAIENVFVYSFSSLLNIAGKRERKELQGLMPMGLHTAYVQQVLKSGI